MKLNHHAKELRDTLEALDFRYDEKESQRRGGHYFHHYAEPDQYIQVFGHISPLAARTAIDKARQIAGLAHAGAEKEPVSKKEQAKVKREQARLKRERERLNYERQIAAIESQKLAERAQLQRYFEMRSIQALMRPGTVTDHSIRHRTEAPELGELIEFIETRWPFVPDTRTEAIAQRALDVHSRRPTVDVYRWTAGAVKNWLTRGTQTSRTARIRAAAALSGIDVEAEAS